MRVNIENVRKYKYLTMIQEVFPLESNSRWSFDREKGLTLNKATLNDSGSYTCVGEMNNKRYNQTFGVMIYGICKVLTMQ